MEYRLSHLGADCSLVRRHEFQAETDAAALQLAWEIFKLTASSGHGFELREGERHVFTHNC